MNKNQIVTNAFSNPESEKLFNTLWAEEPEIAENFHFNGRQCGGCSFYGKFNVDWGLCCHPKSRHHLETVNEHFTCPHQVNEGWMSHSFIDFNAHPASRKELLLKFEIPDYIYDAVEKLVKEEKTETATEQEIYEAIYLKIFNALINTFSK
jgi:hypothetical protein